MKVEFEKNGMYLEVELVGTDLILSVDKEIKGNIEVARRDGNYYYYTLNYEISKLFGAKEANTALYLSHESAMEMGKAQRNAKEIKENSGKEPYTNGSKLIKCEYFSGEILQGYQITGIEAELLKELGLAKDVSGWGILVDNKLIKALGNEFSYVDAKAYTQPKLDKELTEKENQRKAREEIFKTAKHLGHKVKINSYNIPCNDPDEECDLDIVTVWAMPDGTTETTRQHTW